MDKYFVLGNPIANSLSPEIHSEFARQTGQLLSYERLLVPPEGFVQTIKKLYQEKVKGINITLPFKEQAFQHAEQRTERAQIAGSMNTFVSTAEGWKGDNTDGVGLINDLKNHLRWPLANRSILIIGAGGAARGILKPLLDQKPSQVILSNRTIEKASLLAQNFACFGNVKAHGASFSELDGAYFDLIINASSASFYGENLCLPESLIHPRIFCYDLAYFPRMTPFLQWAKNLGCKKWANGLGMLVAQAAEAFFIWRNIKPDPVSALKVLAKISRTAR